MNRKIGEILRTSVVALFLAGLAVPAVANETADSRTHRALAPFFDVLIEGGEWRTPNPDYDGTAGTPSQYVLRHRWGPHGQHMVGALLGYFETADGPDERLFWTLYAVHNPVTDETTVTQIGANGALAQGPLRATPDGRHVVEQILYGPDGSMLAIRHEETMAADRRSFTSDVFERDADGRWKKVREWTWTRRP